MTFEQPTLRKHDAWQHQAEAYHRHKGQPASMIALEMGCGKSKVFIDLVLNEGWENILVLCPLSVRGVWRREFERHWPKDVQDLDVLVLEKGTAKQKAAQLRAFAASMSTVRVVVVNYESAWQPALAEALLAFGFSCVGCDESQRIKAPNGKASKFCAKLGAKAPRRMALSGTPLPHSPLDAYGQYRFLDPSIFGSSYTRFRARYAITDRMFPSLVRKWINQDDFQEKFHSIAHVCKAADVLDLPEVIHDTRMVELSPRTKKIYRDLEKDFVAQVDAGIVTIGNALTKLIRLQQVTSGFVCGTNDFEEQFTEELDPDKEKLLAELLEDITRPAVVFCRFRHDLGVVERVAGLLGRQYGELSGRRRDLTPHSEMLPETQVMGVQIQAGGVGVDLTRACYGIYYSLGYSLGEYLQSLARLHRPGQTQCVRFYHLVAKGTCDEAVYKALEKREEVVESVMRNLGGNYASAA